MKKVMGRKWSFDMENIAVEEKLTVPNFYRPPLGLPLNWRDEISGIMPLAVRSFLNRTQTDAQLRLLRDYLEYYIHAPCWDIPENAFADELEELRQSSKTILTPKEINDWIFKALDIGIDPL